VSHSSARSITLCLSKAASRPGQPSAASKRFVKEGLGACTTAAALPELELAAAQAPLAPLPLEQQEAVARLGAQFWGKWNSNAEPVPAKARELVLKLIKSV
jgi:hypothetical protein